jgi:hypothetical protein
VTRKNGKGKAEAMITELMLVRDTAKDAAQECSRNSKGGILRVLLRCKLTVLKYPSVL